MRKENPLLLAWPLNNYWDTNFESSQSGAMEFSYRFFCMDQFDRTNVYKEFVKAENLGILGAAVHAEKKSEVLIDCSEEGCIASMYPAKGRDMGVIVMMKNHELQKREVSFGIPGWDLIDAWEVTVQEEKRKKLPVEQNRVISVLEPNALKWIRIEHKNN